MRKFHEKSKTPVWKLAHREFTGTKPIPCTVHDQSIRGGKALWACSTKQSFKGNWFCEHWFQIPVLSQQGWASLPVDAPAPPLTLKAAEAAYNDMAKYWNSLPGPKLKWPQDRFQFSKPKGRR